MSNVLFIAEGCTHSSKLVKEFGTCLKGVCDRIYYYAPRDSIVKRKKMTLNAIEYHQIKRFPTLIWESSKRIVGEQTISNALREACQLVENPQFTNLKPDRDLPPQDRVIGNQPKSSISAPFSTQGAAGHVVDTASLGQWPSLDQQQPSSSSQHQAPQQYNNRQQQQQQQQQAQFSQYPTQQQQQTQSSGGGVTGLTIGYDPHMQQQQKGSGGGGLHGIGMGSLIGADETEMAQQNEAQYAQQQGENVGNWPTQKKVQGLTGSGSMGGGAMMMPQQQQQQQQYQTQNQYTVRDQQQRMDLLQTKGQQNMQHANSMVNYGGLVAQPYRC